MNPKVSVETDDVLDVAYIRLSDAPVERTVEHSDRIMVDLDAHGVAVGIEVLGQGVELPYAELVEHYHVHSAAVSLLRLIRPSVSGWAELRAGHDGQLFTGQARDPNPIG